MHLYSYIQQTRKNSNKCLSIKKEIEQQTKGGILIHIKSRVQIVNTAAKQAMCSKVQNVVQKKNDS